MAYIGNTVENQGFTPAIDYFNGNGVTVTFTLSRPIASVAQVIVAVDNVIQNPNSSFTVAGNAITFSSAPLSGTNNIWVEYTSLITTYQAISQDPTVIGDIRATGGYLAEGDFGNSFVAGAIVDYVTGLGRVTVGPAEGIALYNGGTASRTERMRIDSSGNVGIGTNSPNVRLQVTSSSAGEAVRITNGTTAQRLHLYTGNATNTSRVEAQNGDLQLYAYDAFATTFGTNNTERMRITSGGDVGIGTSSPSGKLHVEGGTENAIIGSSTRKLYFRADGSGVMFGTGASQAGNSIYFNGASNLLYFQTNSTERMRITSGGLVGIGTSSPSALLQVAGSSIFQDTVQIFNNPTSSAQGILFRNTFNVGGSIFSTGAATTNDFILWVGGSGTQGAITGNGAGINYSSASDYRLKENVAPMTNALGVVAQLKPCTYTWKFDGSAGQGFIAHELQEVFPDAVTGKKDDVETYTDEDGNEQTKIKPQGVDTSFLVATLAAAIQELKAELDATKAEVQALKGVA